VSSADNIGIPITWSICTK